jgi:sugar phosphate isomerase/epimerase
MLRCFSTLGCAELPLDAVLSLAARHDVGAVELRALGGVMELGAYLEQEFGTPEKLARHLEGRPVRVAAFDGSLRLVDPSAADKEQMVAFAPWAEALGVRWLRAFDGGKDAHVAEFAAAAETLRWWEARRAEHGWRARLMVETHDSLFTAEKIAQFVAAAPGAGILWDSHHTWKKGGEDPVVTWRAIRAHVVHVHVKDSVSAASARHPFTYVLPGDGEYPIGPVLAALRADRFAGPVSLEWERVWHPYLPPLEQALTVAAQRGWW